MVLLNVITLTTDEDVVMTNFRILDYMEWLTRIVEDSIQCVLNCFVMFSYTVGWCDTYESDRAVPYILYGSGTPEAWCSTHVDILVALDSQYMFLQPSLDGTYKYVDSSRNFNFCN